MLLGILINSVAVTHEQGGQHAENKCEKDPSAHVGSKKSGRQRGHQHRKDKQGHFYLHVEIAVAEIIGI